MTESPPNATPAHRSASAWRRWVARVGVDIRAGEGMGALLLFASFVFLFSFQYATKSIRQSTFVDSLGSAQLPWVYLLVAIVSFPLMWLYALLAERLRFRHLMIGTCVAVAASLTLFWWLLAEPAKWEAMALYVWLGIVFALTVSQIWYLASRVFDPRQARRLFGFIGAGALLGSVGGGQIARLASLWAGTRSVLLFAALLILMTGGVLALIYRRVPLDGASGDTSGLVKVRESRGGLSIIRQSRHLQLISLVMMIGVVVSQIVDLQFNWAVESATTSLDERTAFFGNLYSLIGVSAFVFQLVLTARIHRTMGVAHALRVLPTAMVVGAGALLVASGFLPTAIIAVALALKVGENGFRYSLDQSSRELLFLPIPAHLRVKAKAFIDVVFQRAAKGVAALILLPVTFGFMTPVQAAWPAIVLAIAWIVLTRFVHREYVSAFRSGLRQQRVDSTLPIKISDSTTLELLIQSLGSPDPRQVLNSLEVLSVHGRGKLVLPLLLHHDDPQVRRRTLEILAEVGRHDAVPLIERRLQDPEPEIRALAIRVLAQLSGRDVCELMLARLREGNPGVRAAAVACLINHGGDRYTERATRVLQELLADSEASVRAEAAKALSTVSDPAFQEQLIRLLYDSDEQVARQAILAVRQRVSGKVKNPLYLPTLVSLLRNRRLKHDARRALVAFGETAIPALIHFMRAREEDIWVKRALPKAVARIGTRGAAEALLDCLANTRDTFQRRKVIESLGSMGFRATPAQQQTLVGEVRRELTHHLAALRDLASLAPPADYRIEGPNVIWRDGRHEPSLLERLVSESMEDHLRNTFGILALLYEAEHIWPAYRGIQGHRKATRSHALEFLDNTVEGDLRGELFIVIDDLPLDEKLSRARRLGVEPRDRTATLAAFLAAASSDDDRAVSIAAAAIYAIYTDRISQLFPSVRKLATETAHAFVTETADWAMGKLRLEGGTS